MALALIFSFLKNVVYGASVFFTSELTASVDVLDILALRFLMSFVTLFILKQLKLYFFHIIGLILIVLRMVGVSYIDIKKQNSNKKA